MLPNTIEDQSDPGVQCLSNQCVRVTGKQRRVTCQQLYIGHNIQYTVTYYTIKFTSLLPHSAPSWILSSSSSLQDGATKWYYFLKELATHPPTDHMDFSC